MQRSIRAFVFFGVVWSLVFLLEAGAHAQQRLIIYGDDNHPPYSFVDQSGQKRGTYFDVVNTILERMATSYPVEIRLVPWKRAVAHVERGSGFGLFPPHYFPEKRPFLSLYSDPIFEEQPVVFCNRSAFDRPRSSWPQDYYDLKIGVSAGVKMGGEAFWLAVERQEIQIEEGMGIEENLLKLSKLRVDCHINDRVTILWHLHEARLDAKEGVEVSDPSHGYFAISKLHEVNEQDKIAFMKEFNSVLKKMRENGELKEITHRYINSH